MALQYVLHVSRGSLPVQLNRIPCMDRWHSRRMPPAMVFGPTLRSRHCLYWLGSVRVAVQIQSQCRHRIAAFTRQTANAHGEGAGRWRPQECVCVYPLPGRPIAIAIENEEGKGGESKGRLALSRKSATEGRDVCAAEKGG